MSQTPKSAYSIVEEDSEVQRHTFAVIVDNRPGILARVVGMFSARGYNIESLTVSSIDKNRKRSRISIVTTGSEKTAKQIETQLRRIVAVNSAYNVSKSEHVEKEVVWLNRELTNATKKKFYAMRNCLKPK